MMCDFLLQDPIPGSLVVPKLQIIDARCHTWQLATFLRKTVSNIGVILKCHRQLVFEPAMGQVSWIAL